MRAEPITLMMMLGQCSVVGVDGAVFKNWHWQEQGSGGGVMFIGVIQLNTKSLNYSICFCVSVQNV